MPESYCRLNKLPLEVHPPYLDTNLSGFLGQVYKSPDGRFGAVYWLAQGPGRLLEQPQADELICILEGNAAVERHGEKTNVGPGDVIFWLMEDPPVVFVPGSLRAFCVTYHPK